MQHLYTSFTGLTEAIVETRESKEFCSISNFRNEMGRSSTAVLEWKDLYMIRLDLYEACHVYKKLELKSTCIDSQQFKIVELKIVTNSFYQSYSVMDIPGNK